ncbi:hypothetical protein DEALK_04880 [Dehalogenimonas alkenigignens]|uniref:Uncharacterized protein n=1 Tax=Dehalogenimonas alkenigignens TaxID=1217799 RepID=A0A0W0GGH4_9CHLR|nr:hypothetical protein DEALK_04880 [Dehalogenimonas alkenigignens]
MAGTDQKGRSQKRADAFVTVMVFIGALMALAVIFSKLAALE